MELEFSVSICVYGGDNSNYFDAAMNSIVQQTLMPSEIVLTVDGPIPKSIDCVIEKYVTFTEQLGIRFKVIRLEKNVGHGEARRVCLENCEYKLVALMDADDLSDPYRFEKQITYFSKHSDVSLVGGNITEFLSSDDPVDVSRFAGLRIVPTEDIDIKRYMKKRCPMNQVTVMFVKADIESVGGYLDWYCDEDYYLWIRLALAGKKFGNLPDTLVYVRIGKDLYQRRGGGRYFKSEVRLQKLMLEKGIISFPIYISNCIKRFIVQRLMPNQLRAWVFQRFAREKV